MVIICNSSIGGLCFIFYFQFFCFQTEKSSGCSNVCFGVQYRMAYVFAQLFILIFARPDTTPEIYDHKKGNGHSLTSEVQCEDMMADLYQESPGPNKPFYA